MQIFGIKLDWKRLVGDPRLFSLEERIFNTVCIVAFIAMFFEVPFNLSIGLYVPAGLCVFGVFFAIYLYYLSRFKRKSSLGIKLFCFVCNLLFVINYFYNSGILGPNLLLFSLSFLLTVTIIPKDQFRIWIALNLASVFIILTVEYLYPELTKNAYNNGFSKVIDFGITYFVCVLLTYFSISYIRKNYDIERGAVLDQNIAIEEQKQQLEKLNSEKDKLFSIVAHDIKLPLNSIQSYLEILNDTELEGDERQEVQNQLLQITRNTSEMLVNILSWSKTQMDGANTQLTAVNLDEALVSSLRLEKNIASNKSIRLNIEAKGGMSIIADPNMFHLVIRNLVNNAIKFTPRGGEIVVSSEKLNGECLIVVKDNGLGIKPEQQEKLFKLKASSTYGTNNEKGVGLGLLLCKEFTELQGGRIAFKSNEGEGSSFFLYFKLSADK
ncbi:MAG: HAMP domain-containing histidine kinase [Pedobacter sp.]|nr:MAG: HAMP domain-containing histidine kinase [Pedobacter sp.]